MCSLPLVALLAVAVGALFSPTPGAAQAISPAQIEQLRRNPALVRDYIQRSGLTPEEIRARLRASGYPETLLDAYLPGGPAQAPEPGSAQLAALSSLGLPFQLAADRLPPDTGMVTRLPAPPSRVFGVEAFRRTTTQFFPLLAGPVPPDYRLGPGDVLALILTGDVEQTHTLQVAREGFVVIPQVGQVHVANLTLDQLRDVLYGRLGRAYSGVRRGAGATTRFDLSVVNVRASQVYVAGEVLQPGAYQVSALGTGLTALYAAGGVTEAANLRRIEIRRGGQVAGTLDLYDYLLSGSVLGDTRLESGDVVFVPTRGPRVAVQGAVVREGIYELKQGEMLGDVLRAAGGFAADAELRRLTVHRILPPAERGPGPASRAAIDVELASAAGGGSASNHGVSLPPLELRDGDSLVVHRLPEPGSELYVSIAGAVRRPGRFPWRDGITLRELLHLGGGPVVGADLRQAEIARLPATRQGGRLADTVRVPLDSSYLAEREPSGRYAGPPGPEFGGSGSAREVTLDPYDHVLILMQPEFDLHRTVTVLGEVRAPGTYSLTRKDERLTDLIRRAGGVLPTAYPAGARFYRSFQYTGLGDTVRVNADTAADLPQLGRPRQRDQVNVSLVDALARPGTAVDIVLQPDDSVYVPEYLPTVRVSGAVVAPGSVQFVEGKSAEYYIENAGGFGLNADKGRTVVRQANGSARTRSKFLFFTSWPEPGPGAEVYVPAKPPRGPSNLGPVLTAVGSFLAATLSVVIALAR